MNVRRARALAFLCLFGACAGATAAPRASTSLANACTASAQAGFERALVLLHHMT